MARICDLTGKRSNVAHRVSHSNIKTKRRQYPNLQVKRVWWEEEKKFVTLKLSTRALRTLARKTLGEMLRDQGLELN